MLSTPGADAIGPFTLGLGWALSAFWDAFFGRLPLGRNYIWDLLNVNETDLRIQPYEIRYVYLTQHFRGVCDVLRVCETAMTPKAKRDFVKRMHGTNVEGFVCKNRNVPYAGGRAGQHYKCKFVVTASFTVGAKPEKKANDGHRSVALYLLDGNQQRFMGTVGVPDRYRLPKEGEVVEVQYSTATPEPKESSSKQSISARSATTSSPPNAP